VGLGGAAGLAGGTVGAAWAVVAVVSADGSGAGGGLDGVTAHQSPTPRKSAAPRAGSHMGDFGSSSGGAAVESTMAGTSYHTLAQNVVPTLARDQRLHLDGAMLRFVKHSSCLAASLALACIAAPALAQSTRPPALPPLPAQGATAAVATTPAAGTPAANSAAMPTPAQLYEHVTRGIVAIEHNGVPTAIGTVLGGDGRILTALSGLGGSEGADVRYADGTTVHAKVGHSDRDSDLALLVPQAGRWTDGLSASETDPARTALRAMLPGKGAHMAPAEAGVKGRVDAHARDGTPLLQMLDIDLKGPPIAGAPLLDSTGGVVGVLVRACKGIPQTQPDSPWAGWGGAPQAAPKTAACAPVVLGAPVTTIRSFLAKTPSTAVAPAPWLGIRGEAQTQGSTRGVKLTAVAPQSPADKGGLKAGTDTIVAVEGQPIDSPDGLAAAIGKHAPGDTVKLLVFSGDKFREVPVTLRTAP
jgi:serine protease Do